MNLLAIECSTATGTLALFQDNQLLDEKKWPVSTRGNDALFSHLSLLSEKHHIGLNKMDAFAVGRGPGRYSGMRCAMTTAQALALPEKKDVHALSSGLLMAAKAFETTDAEQVTVVGDARRGHWWTASFTSGNDGIKMVRDYSLVKTTELGMEGGMLVSSEQSRLYEQAPQASWLRQDIMPSAATLGRLVLEKIQTGQPTEPLLPLYLHAAV